MAHTILLVDKTPDPIEALPDRLRQEGYETLIAARGSQALALGEEARPDLILLNTALPDMDGLEVCRRLRLNPATCDIPVMLMFAPGASSARADSQAAEAADFVIRPLQLPELLSRIQRLIRSRNSSAPIDDEPLQEMAQAALNALPVKLAWLLAVDEAGRSIISRAIAAESSDVASRFLAVFTAGEEPARFPLARTNTPLADVALTQSALINVPASQLQDRPGGAALARACVEHHLGHVTLLPLVTQGRSVGVLLLAGNGAYSMESRQVQRTLAALNGQAAAVLDNVRLLAELARHDQRLHADYTAHQRVLDTLSEGVLVADDQARITYANKRLLRLTGYTREALYGASAGLIFHAASRDRLIHSLTGLPHSTLPFSQQLVTTQNDVVPVLMSRVKIPSPHVGEMLTAMIITDLSELQRSERDLKLQTGRLEAINRASNALASARTLRDVMRIGLDSAVEIVQGVSASLHTFDPQVPGKLTLAQNTGPRPANVDPQSVAIGQELLSRVAQLARSQLVTGSAADDHLPENGEHLRSQIVVPLVSSNAVIGVLEVTNRLEGSFDAHDRDSLESFAGSLATAITNARLFEQTRHRMAEQSTLLDSSAAVSSTLDIGAILEQIAGRMSAILRVERVIITNWHQRPNHLESLAEIADAFWSLETGPARSLTTLPITCSVIESGTMMLAADTELDEYSQPVIETVPSGLWTVGGFPLWVGGQIVGVLTLHTELPGMALSAHHADIVQDVVKSWQDTVSPDTWSSRARLTNLCHHAIQASGTRWSSVWYWDRAHNQLRLIRELGRALWIETTGPARRLATYPSLERALHAPGTTRLLTADLDAEQDEHAYLHSVGGTTCLIAPLPRRSQPGGLILLIDTKPDARQFDEHEMSLCLGLASVVGDALENAQLYLSQEQRALALEAAYQALQDADQFRSERLRKLSLELQAPMTHMLGYLHLMANGEFGALPAEQQSVITMVADKAQHLVSLIKDIIALQDNRARLPDLRPTRLDRVVLMAIRGCISTAQARGITITSQIPDTLPLAFIDPDQIGEVIAELLRNAVKFSPDNTQIAIAIEESADPTIIVRVRDHGIGIDPDDQDRIFEPFHQVHHGTTRRFGGTGLGLAVVRQVIEAHHGRVWVESQPGQGSCFCLTLPKLPSSEAEPGS